MEVALSLRFDEFRFAVRISGLVAGSNVHHVALNFKTYESLGVKFSLVDEALFTRLNDLNSGGAHLHFPARMNVVFAVTEIPAEPYVPDQVSIAVQDYCGTTELAHEIVRAEFGSLKYLAGTAPGTIRH
jgi:hypothetical protein